MVSFTKKIFNLQVQLSFLVLVVVPRHLNLNSLRLVEFLDSTCRIQESRRKFHLCNPNRRFHIQMHQMSLKSRIKTSVALTSVK